MKSLMHKTVLAGVFALIGGGAGAATTVTYVQPDKFTDLSTQTAERTAMLKELSQHFTKLGKRLSPGETLHVEVTDIDLAGRLFPSTRLNREVRVLRDQADWPRLTFRYTIEQNGQVVQSGEEQLVDMNYLGHTNRYYNGDPLRFEKQMLDTWFKKTVREMPRTASR